MISADSVEVSIGYGFGGIVMRLELADGFLRGIGTMWHDRTASGIVGHATITARPFDCSRRSRESRR